VRGFHPITRKTKSRARFHPKIRNPSGYLGTPVWEPRYFHPRHGQNNF
jgi:hypothetical protein